jgi:hypothetical protein
MSDQAAPGAGGDDDGAGLVKTVAESKAVESFKKTLLTCLILIANGWSCRLRSVRDPQQPRRRAVVVMSAVSLAVAGTALTHSHLWAMFVRLFG